MSRKPPVPASNNIQDSEEALSVLVNVAVTLLSQCIEFLDQGVTDAQLSRESKLSPGATIGKHLRHLLDYYRPLANAAHSTPEGQVLSFSKALSQNCPYTPILIRLESAYDKRSRNTPAETSVSSAKNALSDLRKSLLDLPSTVKLARKVRLEATTPFLLTVDSTFGREVRGSFKALPTPASLIRANSYGSHHCIRSTIWL